MSVRAETCRAEEARAVAVEDWQSMSWCRRWNSILWLRSEFWWTVRALSSIASIVSLRIADGYFRNRGSLVLESARIFAQRGLVDTIVNTGGNSCKKFEPPVARRSRIIFVAVPSPSLLSSKSSVFVLRLTVNVVLPFVRSGLDNCFQLLFCLERKYSFLIIVSENNFYIEI